MTTRILVIGATGILRPATEALASSGTVVVAAARTRADLELLAGQVPGVEPWAVDYRDEDTLQGAGRGMRLDHALAYMPEATAATRHALRTIVNDTVVEVLPSALATPDQAEPFDLDRLPDSPAAPWHRLVLGWTQEHDWHSAEQISAAALQTLRSGQDQVLGSVRPWSDRPHARAVTSPDPVTKRSL